MEWMEVLQKVFDLCLIPIAGALATYLVVLIKKKTAEAEQKAKDNTTKKYLQILSDTVRECVIATDQTYVEALKEDGQFDEEAQKIAFNRTFDAVKSIITKEMLEYLSKIYDDVDLLIESKIEAEVNYFK